MLSPRSTPAPVGLALSVAEPGVPGEVLVMVVALVQNGQVPMPAGMLVPKVIRSYFWTPLPVALADIVTVEFVVLIDETVVPEAIAVEVVMSLITMPAVILFVTTPDGNVRVFEVDPVVGVAALVAVPASVAAATDPVAKAFAAVIDPLLEGP
jgi:hypothetical protein